jgi:hypothetical protein
LLPKDSELGEGRIRIDRNIIARRLGF